MKQIELKDKNIEMTGTIILVSIHRLAPEEINHLELGI